MKVKHYKSLWTIIKTKISLECLNEIDEKIQSTASHSLDMPNSRDGAYKHHMLCSLFGKGLKPGYITPMVCPLQCLIVNVLLLNLFNGYS